MIIRERRFKLHPGSSSLLNNGLAIIPFPLAGATVNPQGTTVTAEGGSLRAAPEVSTIRDVNLARAISSGGRRSVTVRF